jgi:aspartate kinase
MGSVAKFGGSSVKDSHNILKCVEIIKRDPSICLVILSATYNTTNQIEEVFFLASQNLDEAIRNWHSVIHRHTQMAQELFLQEEVSDSLGDISVCGLSIIHEYHKNTDSKEPLLDEMYSLGERMSSLIFFHLIQRELPLKRTHLIDARDVVVTDSKFQAATPLMDKLAINCQNKLLPYFKEGQLIVTQGFVGRSECGKTTTLGREGSDYSASLMSWGVDASDLQIWKDVEGIFSTDPRVYPKATPVKQLTYSLAEEMTFLGAKVLFPKTMNPLKEKSIPIKIACTFRPEGSFTIISNQAKNTEGVIGVSLKELSFGEVNVSLIGSHFELLENEFNLFEEFFKIKASTQGHLSWTYKVERNALGQVVSYIHELLIQRKT